MANESEADAVRTHRNVRTRAGRMLGTCLLGLAVLSGGVARGLAQSDAKQAFFPNMTEAFVPRGSAQLLKGQVQARTLRAHSPKSAWYRCQRASRPPSRR